MDTTIQPEVTPETSEANNTTIQPEVDNVDSTETVIPQLEDFEKEDAGKDVEDEDLNGDTISRIGYTLHIVNAGDNETLTALRNTGKSMGEISVNAVTINNDHADEIIIAIRN